MIRGTARLIGENLKAVLPFLFIYPVFNMIACSVAVKLLMRLAAGIYGVTYIGQDNILGFMRAPSTVVILLILVLLISLSHAAGIAGLVYAYTMRVAGASAGLASMIFAGLRTAGRSLLPWNWTLVPLVIVQTLVQAFIPTFVLKYFNALFTPGIIHYALFAGLLMAEMLFVFAMHFYVIRECSFTAACRESLRLIRGRFLKTVAWLAVFPVLQFCVNILLSAAAPSAAGIYRAVMSVLAPGVNIAVLTRLFADYIEKDNRQIDLSREPFANHGRKPWSVFVSAALITALISVYFVQNAQLWKQAMTSREYPVIVAHRGDSANAPENTYPAFRLAADGRAEWAELDVHRTKDGVIVVCHDENLKRISGADVFVHDLTYDQIMKLDVGSRFSKDYEGVRITTLDEALKVLRNMFVQVEIKPEDMAEGIEEDVLGIINANNMHDQTAILCFEPGPLERVKEIDPSMKTIYCMSLAWGSVTDFPYADMFSIEVNSITRELVAEIHERGSIVFCWTVNDEDSLQRLVDCGVDGIVTDDPARIRSALHETSRGGGFTGILRYCCSLMFHDGIIPV